MAQVIILIDDHYNELSSLAVRMWSLLTFTALMCFRGHNYPVWAVEFRYAIVIHHVTIIHQHINPVNMWTKPFINTVHSMSNTVSSIG